MQDWSSESFSSRYLGCHTAHILSDRVLFPSIIHYLGDINGKNILDLGCGEGDFCHLVKSSGAAEVVGVDISSVMVGRAQRITSCKFQLGDARCLGNIGQFDCITSNCMLPYAENVANATGVFRSIYKNLKFGGKFVGTIINSSVDANWGSTLQKYGIPFYSVLPSTTENEIRKFKAVISVGLDKPPFEVTINLLSIDDFKTALRAAGFVSFSFEECFINENVIKSYPVGFWDNYTEKPCHLCITADKI